MDNSQAFFVGFAVLVVVLFTGMPIGAVMAGIGVLGFIYLSGVDAALGLLKVVPYSTAASYTMSVMPMFVLMGQLIYMSGISQELYTAAHKWFGRRPGGLAHATIWAGVAFGALSGSAAASTATFGAVALPEMRKYKYQGGFAAAMCACAGTIDIMIPPSTLMILYGILTETSIGKLFIAGFVPGVILALMYDGIIWWQCKRDPTMGPAGPSSTWSEKFKSLGGCWATLLLFAVVMGGMWRGFFTPTESGALGAFGSLLVMMWKGKFNRANMRTALTGTTNIVGLAMMVLIGAYLFGYFATITNAPMVLANMIRAVNVPPLAVPAGIMVLYFFLGWAMDELTVIVLTTPLFFPILMELGFDPVWWGIMCVISIQQGQMSPPVGLNLNIICGMTKDYIPQIEVFRAVIPYAICLFFFGVIILLVPDLALWAPTVFYSGK